MIGHNPILESTQESARYVSNKQQPFQIFKAEKFISVEKSPGMDKLISWSRKPIRR